MTERRKEPTAVSDHLLRALAPIPAIGWKLIDAEAKQRLSTQLAARRLVDWNGPHGWRYSATDLGRIRRLDGASTGGEQVAQRVILPVTEFRIPFTVSRAELDNAARGADDLDFGDLERAASRAAECENIALLHGWAGAGVTGITAAASHRDLKLGEDASTYPHTVALAVGALRGAGIEGPYALAIGPAGYQRIVESTESGGLPLLEHLCGILGGDVVWAPGVDGAVVLTQRGGDFALEVGQDFAVGYTGYNAETVQLYLEVSFTFRVVEPDAAVALTV